MNNPEILITDEYVIIDGEIISIEDFDFSECPMTEELYSIITEGEAQ